MTPEQGTIILLSGIRDYMAVSSGIRASKVNPELFFGIRAPLVLELGHLSVSGIRARHVLEFRKGSLEFSERVC